MKSNTEILDEVRNSSHGKVRVAITDIDGVLRGKFMHKNKFLSAAEGDGLIVSFDYREQRKAPLPDVIRERIETLEDLERR